MSEERVDSNDSLLATAKRAIGLVDAHGSVTSSAPRINRATRSMDEALVELMVENINAGYVVPPCFLRQPSHLPETEKEQRVLALSKVDRDQQLKADMFEWVAINRRVCSQAATTLRNAIVAVRLAEALLNEGDQNDQLIYEQKTIIEDHIARTYKLDIREAPGGGPELESWCEAKLGEFSPVGEWLRDGRVSAPQNVFVPKAGSTMRLLDKNRKEPEADPRRKERFRDDD